MIYADANGTYPLTKTVKNYLLNRLDGPFGNPNAIHSIGKNIKSAYEKCRDITAEALGASRNQVIFTSGSSEAISQYISSFGNCNKKKVLCSPIEHAAVHNACIILESSQGFEFIDMKVDKSGVCSSTLEKEYSLACLMAANNETGIIQPFIEFGEKCQERNTPFFCDTTQILGKIDFNFQKTPIDACAFSSHKIGSLPGSGILLVKDPSKIKPLIQGGGQEFGLRGGTQNYLNVECMTVALQEVIEQRANFKKLETLKKNFEEKVQAQIPEAVIFGKEVSRLSNTTLLSIPGIHGQALQIELESRDIFVTTSSACSDNEPGTSRVLKAMGHDDKIGRGVVRMSFQSGISKEKLDHIAQAILNSYQSLKKIKSF